MFKYFFFILAFIVFAACSTTEKKTAESESVMAEPDPNLPICMDMPCETHNDCKKEGCEATFCTGELGKFRPKGTKKLCVVRCDPANYQNECPFGYICDSRIQMAGMFVNIDGTRGLCKPIGSSD